MQHGNEQGYGSKGGGMRKTDGLRIRSEGILVRSCSASAGISSSANPSVRTRSRRQRPLSTSAIEFGPEGVTMTDGVEAESECGDPPLSLLVEEDHRPYVDQKAFVDWRGWKD